MDKEKHCPGISVLSILVSVVYIRVQWSTLYGTVSVYTKYGAHAVSDYDFAASFLWFFLHCSNLFRLELIVVKSCKDFGCDGVSDPCDQQTSRCFQHSWGGCHTASPDRHCRVSELGEEVNVYHEMLEFI